MLQIILLTIAGIILLLLLAAAVMKKSYELHSVVVINKSNKEVFDYIKYLKNQEQYSKWVMADPNAKLVYTGTDGTVGFKASWESPMKDVGVGEQEILKITENIGYDVEIRFKKPFEGISYANTTIEKLSDNQSKLTTTFKTTTPFPMNIMVPMLSKMLTRDMDENSARLKANVERG
ncbi:MAG: SRPBCC family protein [Bacteroidetes bacterium]|nr:SRPBCC family protein [Bacteroidota bacterium]